jgi:hypothetical protein
LFFHDHSLVLKIEIGELLVRTFTISRIALETGMHSLNALALGTILAIHGQRAERGFSTRPIPSGASDGGSRSGIFLDDPRPLSLVDVGE